MTRYELVERIGAGGMAEIFRGRAMAIGGFEKPVAIKKILPALGSDQRFVKMLIAEAKILATLRHRNIVQIFDVGLSDQAEYFLVMEFVDGIDLGALYETFVAEPGQTRQPRRFPVDLALHLGCEVAEALEHAHRAVDENGRSISLIHRDVSPTNVMLSSAGEVKLTDFGIAKRGDNASIVQSIKGKFAYMSPEQARALPLTPASDLYSLGIILWELLLGRRLFLRDQDSDVLELVREGKVPRPSDLQLDFSRGLESLLMKLLDYSPAARFQSAGELGAALRDYRYSAATSAGDPARELANLVRRFAPKRLADKAAGRGEVRLQTVLVGSEVEEIKLPDFGHEEDGGDATTIDDPTARPAPISGELSQPTVRSADEEDATREVTRPRPRTQPPPASGTGVRTPSTSGHYRTPSILERIAAHPTRPPADAAPVPPKRARRFRRAARQAPPPPVGGSPGFLARLPLPLQMLMVALAVAGAALLVWWVW